METRKTDRFGFPCFIFVFFTNPVHNALIMLFDAFTHLFSEFFCALSYVKFEHLLSYIYVYICI